ncbi:MAG: IS21 family transposase, partial [Candidatus Microthrix parvicella]
MAYREVAVFEVREVLRLWLALLAFRRIAEMVRCDRKTVTKIVRIAESHGLVRTDSPGRLTDDFVGGVFAELAPKVPDRHGEAWNVLVGHREKLEGWRNDDVPAKKMVELLGRKGVV